MSDFSIIELTDPQEKPAAVRQVLEALPEWFGVPESTEGYIKESAGQLCFAAYEQSCDSSASMPLGILCLKQTGDATMELAVMGVRKEYHRRGIGCALFEAAKARASGLGCQFLQVKTVQMGRYACYDDTNRFYQSMGFREFEVLPSLWGWHNPCQIYVMALK